MLFLIDYDRRAGKVVSMRSFEDSVRTQAYIARFELERTRGLEGDNHEVVLLEAADEAVIRQTHRRYFADLRELSQPPNGKG